VENSHKLPLWLRWWGILNGAVTFIWLPAEDIRYGFITFLSAIWCALFGSWLWIRFGGRWGKIYRGLAVGGASGAGFFPIALILAILKAGIHAHGFLDYSNYELEQLLSYTPATVLGGAILGGLIGIWLEKRGKTGDSGQNV
jgi:hypothetical protein